MAPLAHNGLLNKMADFADISKTFFQVFLILIQILSTMTWHRTGDKPLPEPMMIHFGRLNVSINLDDTGDETAKRPSADIFSTPS